MTTVVMVQTADEVLVGWDSRQTRGNEVATQTQDKVFVNGGLIFGVSGTLRANELFRTLDFEYNGADAYTWLTREFCPVVRDYVRQNPEGLQSEDGSWDFGLLMVVDGTVFGFDVWGTPYSTEEGVYTLGSGGDYARGALFSGANVSTALLVAAAIDPYTGGPVTVTTASQMLLSQDG